MKHVDPEVVDALCMEVIEAPGYQEILDSAVTGLGIGMLGVKKFMSVYYDLADQDFSRAKASMVTCFSRARMQKSVRKGGRKQ